MVSDGTAVPLAWYRLSLPPVSDLSTEFGQVAYALDLGSMGKGHVWINGHALGRYWNITSSLPTTPTNPYPKPDDPLVMERMPARDPTMVDAEQKCDYAGPFFQDKCRDGPIGEKTQQYYHVPRLWLNKDAENVAVLFEEEGGQLDKVRLVLVEQTLAADEKPRFVIQHSV